MRCLIWIVCLPLLVLALLATTASATDLKDRGTRKIADVTAYFQEGIAKDKDKKNRIYTDQELIEKLGEPQSKSNVGGGQGPVDTRRGKVICLEYDCADGKVAAHFVSMGYTRDKERKLRLQIRTTRSLSSGNSDTQGQ
jgi:hypothetical protein